MGSRNYASLSKNAILISGNADWFARWCRDYREVGQEQTEANHIWTGREASKRAEGCQICWMLSTNTGMDIERSIGEWRVLLVRWLMGTHHIYCLIICDIGITLCRIYRWFATTLSRLKILNFSGETLIGFEVLRVQWWYNCSSAASFCKLRYDAIPVQSASANVSFCTYNSKMTNFELWHSYRKWAMCWYIFDPIFNLLYNFLLTISSK